MVGWLGGWAGEGAGRSKGHGPLYNFRIIFGKVYFEFIIFFVLISPLLREQDTGARNPALHIIYVPDALTWCCAVLCRRT